MVTDHEMRMEALRLFEENEKLSVMLADATRRLEDSNDILAKLIDAEAALRRMRQKLEEIHDITQETNPRIECWEKLQNIEATAASALASHNRAPQGE